MAADVGVGVGGEWVLCGWQHGCGAGCVGGGGVWGFEHRRTPTRTPASVCLSACLLPVCIPTCLGTLVSPTDRDTVHYDYHGTVVPVRTHETRGTAVNPSVQSSASQPRCKKSCSILELPPIANAKAKQRTEATDPQDSGSLPWSSSPAGELNNVHQSYPALVSRLTTSAQHSDLCLGM